MKQLKKILSVLLVLAMIVAYVPPIAVSAEIATAPGGSADFNTINSPNGSTSYGSYTTTNGWTIVNSAIHVGGTSDSGAKYTVVGPNNSYKAPCLNGKTTAAGKLTSPTLTTGISKLTIQYTKMFADTKIGVNVTIKDAAGNTYTHVIAKSNLNKDEKCVKYTDEWVLETPVVGNFTIEVVNNSPSKSSSNKDRITILSLAWDGAVNSGDEGGSEPEKPTKFDVSFDLNGAEGTAPATIQVVEGAAYGTLPAPTRKGHTFDGWFKTADCSGEAVTAETIVTEAHTLYAKWTAKPVVAVSFDLNGAEGTAPMDAMVAVGEAYEALPEVAREGYIFCGWFTDSGCTGDAVKATDIVEEAHTLYAMWIKGAVSQTTIDFSTKDQRTEYTTSKQVWENEGLTLTNEKGGSSSNVADYCAPARFYKSSNMKIACDNMIKIVFVANSNDYASDLNSAITAAGFTSSVNGKDVTVSFSTPVAEMAFSLTTAKVFLDSMTVTMLAPVQEYNVSFDLNGAEGTAPATRQVEEGAAYGELPEVSREGYTFGGWFTEAACTNAVTAETIVTESHTLYAKWTYIPTEDSSDIVENWGLTLKDEVVVKFNMTFTPETLADAGAYVEVKVDDEITKIAVADVAGPLEIPVSAAQMTDEITLCVVKGNENRGEEMVFTVRQYCETILADEKYAAYHPLVKEMLNYGGYAQAYFGHNTDNMANEGLKDVGLQDISADAAPEKVVSGEIEGISYYGASLLLRDKVALRFYFTVTGDIAEYTFKVNGKEVNWGKKNGMYYIDASDIPAWDLATPVTVTVNDTLTIINSPMNYIVGMSNNSTPGLSALVKALYNYHLAAKAFMAQG